MLATQVSEKRDLVTGKMRELADSEKAQYVQQKVSETRELVT